MYFSSLQIIDISITNIFSIRNGTAVQIFLSLRYWNDEYTYRHTDIDICIYGYRDSIFRYGSNVISIVIFKEFFKKIFNNDISCHEESCELSEFWSFFRLFQILTEILAFRYLVTYRYRFPRSKYFSYNDQEYFISSQSDTSNDQFWRCFSTG